MASPLLPATQHLRTAVDRSFRGDEPGAKEARAAFDRSLHFLVASLDGPALVAAAQQLEELDAGLLLMRLPQVWVVTPEVRGALEEVLQESNLGDPYFARPPSFRAWGYAEGGTPLDCAIDNLLFDAWHGLRHAMGVGEPEGALGIAVADLRRERALEADRFDELQRRLRTDERAALVLAEVAFPVSASEAARAAM